MLPPCGNRPENQRRLSHHNRWSRKTAMLLYNIVSGKPRLGCMLHNRQKPSGESLCYLHPPKEKSILVSPTWESHFFISLLRRKEAMSHSSAPEHGIVNAQLHNLSGSTKENTAWEFTGHSILGLYTSTHYCYSCGFLLDKCKKHKSLGQNVWRR